MDYIFSGGEKISIKDMSRKLELIEELEEIKETRKVIGGYLDGEGRGKLYIIHPNVEKKYNELGNLGYELRTILRKEYGNEYSYDGRRSNIIYGDDYKILIEGNCLTIKDYDENQELEAEISIRFSEEELEQLISILSK